ncbi:hypothetical protein WAB17_03025 [Parerythrobacter aurantius]|uniref:Nmad3 family putative nucleotide modification protein n=1 Tax=Parerythrobacter aurantius TaxID=3127706 RepID=UPI003247A2CB
MRIVFSRKGFDSAAGGGASPIAGGRPVSLPIPSGGWSRTSYADLGLGELVEEASRGKIGRDDFCHHDPMFLPDGTCLFGQCGAAQTHLRNRGVDKGDVFLFFGLFREEETGERHHRIFGYLRISDRIDLAASPAGVVASLAGMGHPHALGLHAGNDAIWVGEGRTASRALPDLRLTVPGGPAGVWHRPQWLRHGGLSYHDRRERWLTGNRLRSVSRGQEFVADIGRRRAPRLWADHIIDLICDQTGERSGK